MAAGLAGRQGPPVVVALGTVDPAPPRVSSTCSAAASRRPSPTPPGAPYAPKEIPA
jgi:hypothetical protein